MRCPLPIIGVTAVLLLVRFMESQSDILLSPPTGFDTSEPQQWRHCPGKLNPADDGSLGLRADAITSNCRWLNGPAFLLLSEDQWPEDISKSKFAPDVTCEVPCETLMSVVDGWKLNPLFIDLSRYSSFVKVCRITAYVKRFIQNCRRRKEKMEMKIGPLEVQEIKKAKLMWIKSAQREAFPFDICNLSDGKLVGVKSRLKTLTPFLDESDILRDYSSRSSAVSSCNFGLPQEA